MDSSNVTYSSYFWKYFKESEGFQTFAGEESYDQQKL